MSEVRTDPEAQPGLYGPVSLSPRQVQISLAAAVLALFLGSLDQTIVGIAMPQIIADVGGFTHYTWITTIYLITSTIAAPLTGKLSDMFGRKVFYIGGLSIFVVGSLLCGLSQTMTQLIIFRGVQGIGAGVILATAFIVIGDLFPPSERGKYQGLTAGVFGIAALIGPLLGGVITDYLSWNWVFYINGPLGILIIALFALFLPNVGPAQLRRKVDYAGVGALVLTVVPAMLALSWAGVEYPWVSLPIISMFAFSALMAAVFVLIEGRADEPIMPLWIFRNRIVAVSVVVIALTGFAMYGGIVYIPLFFQGVLGSTATTSGAFLTPLLLAVVVGSLGSGQVLSRAGGHYRTQGLIGLAIMAVGVGLLSTMSAETSYPTAVVYITIVGLGLGITFPLYTIAIQNAVPYAVMGIATSSATFFRSIGGVLGLAILGSVMNNRFAPEFLGRLSPEVVGPISPEPLNSLTHDPQALLNVEAQAELAQIYDALGQQGEGLFDQVMEALKMALESSLADIFLIGLGVVILAWLVNLLIREIPLRKHHV